jgi:DNA-directed RNA polymerase beta' subunit
MDLDFITLPDDVETLQKQLLEKEKRIQELILENLSLKNLDTCDSIEELEVELDENAETIDLKKFDDEHDDDEGTFPNLGENVNQGDFMNILKMLLTQGTQGTYGHQKSEGFTDPNPSLNSNEDEEEDVEEEGDDQEDIIEDLPVD